MYKRQEDTDKERNTEEALQVLIEGMQWLGLDWDEGPGKEGQFGPYFQSQRSAIYEEYLNLLKSKNRVYEKEGALWFRLEGERYTEYDDFKKAEVEKVKNTPVVIDDAIRGRVERTEERDFVIVRSNGEPVFHFVNVVDDISMKITHVIRGEDHLSNTSKHVELFKAFGVKPPIFAHIPLILKESGPGKMSKRDKGALIEEYQKRGFVSDAVRNYICLLGWNPKDDQEKMSIQTIIERFDFDGINKGNARFDEQKLAALNSGYLKELSIETLTQLALPELEEAGCVTDQTDRDYLHSVLRLVQPKIKSLDTLADYVGYFFQERYEEDAKALARIQKNGNAKELLAEVMIVLEGENHFAPDSLEASLTEIAEKKGRKLFAYFPIIRFAISGRSGGPDLLPLLAVMGRDRVLSRLRAFLENTTI